MSKVNLCLKALGAVSGFNHYTPHYFEWKAGYDDIIATFHNECAAVRSSEHDASKRMEMMDALIDKMDDAIIELINTYYPKDKDGNWSEPAEGSPVVPALVVNNDNAAETPNINPVDEQPETVVALG